MRCFSSRALRLERDLPVFVVWMASDDAGALAAADDGGESAPDESRGGPVCMDYKQVRALRAAVAARMHCELCDPLAPVGGPFHTVVVGRQDEKGEEVEMVVCRGCKPLALSIAPECSAANGVEGGEDEQDEYEGALQAALEASVAEESQVSRQEEETQMQAALEASLLEKEA